MNTWKDWAILVVLVLMIVGPLALIILSQEWPS